MWARQLFSQSKTSASSIANTLAAVGLFALPTAAAAAASAAILAKEAQTASPSRPDDQTLEEIKRMDFGA